MSFENLSIILIKMKKAKTTKVKIRIKPFFAGLCKKCSFVKTKKFKVVLAVIASLVLLGFIVKTVFLAAFVNGRPISRITLIKSLEKQGGESALNTLIEKSLLLQEAKKTGVNVTKEEVQKEITAIEEILSAQNITLDQALEARSQTREELMEQIEMRKIIEVLLADKITVTDEELKDYFDKNQNYFDKGTLFEDIRDQIKDEIVQQKLSDEYTIWMTDLKAKAKILYLLKF